LTLNPPVLSVPALSPLVLSPLTSDAAPATGLAPLIAGPLMQYAPAQASPTTNTTPHQPNVNLAASRGTAGGGAPVIMFGLCVFAILLGMRGAGRVRRRVRAQLRR
jgi:hypothetical protein